MAEVTLFKYLIISNKYLTMNGFNDKDTILVIYFYDKNFNLVRLAVQFPPPQKSHIWCKNHNFFEPCQNIGSFASATKGMDTFLFEMSMK